MVQFVSDTLCFMFKECGEKRLLLCSFDLETQTLNKVGFYPFLNAFGVYLNNDGVLSVCVSNRLTDFHVHRLPVG
jgi:hypothetical protein